jgi:hypothetical protein
MKLNELTSLPLLFVAIGAIVGSAVSLFLFETALWVHLETSAPMLGFFGAVAGLLFGTIIRRNREISRSSQTLAQIGQASLMFGATLVLALLWLSLRQTSDLMLFDSIFFGLGGIMLLAGQVSVVLEGIVDAVIFCFTLVAFFVTHDVSWLVLAAFFALAVYGLYFVRLRDTQNARR